MSPSRGQSRRSSGSRRRGSRAPGRARVRLRRTAAALFLAAGALAVLAAPALVSGGPRRATTAAATPRPGVVRFTGPGGKTLLQLGLRPLVAGGLIDRKTLAASVRRRLAPEVSVRRRRATIRYDLMRGVAIRRAIALGIAGGSVAVPASPLEASVRAPVVSQRLRNNCETAALQILLATVGRRVDQLTLQRKLRRDGPLDPIGLGSTRVWGDPERGFVGRPAGGGVAGGFGVYERPIAALALRYGERLVDLSDRRPSAVYQRLLAGRAVLAWVGMSDGPYGRWRAPRARTIQVNFGEHAVVVAGIREDGTLEVVNPLRGTFELWTPGKFEQWWARLGRRALST